MRWTEEDLAAYNARQLHQTFRESKRVETDAPEAPLLRKVLALAKEYSWLCYHTHDSRRSEQGFPDLVLVRDTSVIFAELKSSKGKLTREQLTWLETLKRTGQVEVYLWRPDDFPLIQARLTEPSHSTA